MNNIPGKRYTYQYHIIARQNKIVFLQSQHLIMKKNAFNYKI